VANGFDKRRAFLQMANDSISIFTSAVAETEHQIMIYYILFYIFLDTIGPSKDSIKHLNIDTFVVLCELSLIVTQYTSAAWAFLYLSRVLAKYSNEISSLIEGSQITFVDDLLTKAGYPVLSHLIERALQGLKEIWLQELSVVLEGKTLNKGFGMGFVKTNGNFEKLYLLRTNNKANPLIFPQFLELRSLMELLDKYCSDVFIAFNNNSIPFFDDHNKIPTHMSYLTATDFFINALHAKDTQCILEQNKNWRFCGYQLEDNFCESHWPDSRWPLLKPECPRIRFINTVNELIE
jgi:hypothetical protein